MATKVGAVHPIIARHDLRASMLAPMEARMVVRLEPTNAIGDVVGVRGGGAAAGQVEADMVRMGIEVS